MNENIISRLVDLIGIDETEVLLAELGGTTIHIPRLDGRAKGVLEGEYARGAERVARLKAQFGPRPDQSAKGCGMSTMTTFTVDVTGDTAMSVRLACIFSFDGAEVGRCSAQLTTATARKLAQALVRYADAADAALGDKAPGGMA